MCISNLKSDFLDDYKCFYIGVKWIAGGGSILGSGTILQKFSTRCVTTLYLPSHGYHIPKSDIRL